MSSARRYRPRCDNAMGTRPGRRSYSASASRRSTTVLARIAQVTPQIPPSSGSPSPDSDTRRGFDLPRPVCRFKGLQHVEIGHRFDHVHIEPDGSRPLTILLLPPPGQCHERCTLAPFVAAYLSRSLVSIHLRHTEVKQNNVWHEALGYRKRVDPVMGDSHLVSAELEQLRQGFGGIVVVVGHEHASPFERRQPG